MTESFSLREAERLTQLVANVLFISIESLSTNLNMQDYGTWDSLSHIQLIRAIEDDFLIELNADEIAEMTNIESIRRIVLTKTAAV